jgi:hypothetical protein
MRGAACLVMHARFLETKISIHSETYVAGVFVFLTIIFPPTDGT